MLYKRLARDHKWPLELKIPNKETLQAFKDTDNGIDLVDCKDLDDLFKDLDI